MNLTSYKYFPLLRTRQAELKAICNLNWKRLRRVCPIVELTNSRRSAKNKNRDIQKNLDVILTDVVLDRFILDVTVEPDFSNRQTERLLDPSNAFKNWTDFVREIECEELIPVIHISEDMKLADLRHEVETLANDYQSLAVRLDYQEPSNVRYVKEINEVLNDPVKLCVILDGGFIRIDRAADHEDLFLQTIQGIKHDFAASPVIVILSSSFPSSVVQHGYGKDHKGDFPLEEVRLTRLMQSKEADMSIVHGDYATVHPKRYPEIYGGWVPRVDVPLTNDIYYYRYRRSEGGYELAAKRAFRDVRYKSVNSWGNEQIEKAAVGNVEGLNPSHWIAVRITIHISTQAKVW